MISILKEDTHFWSYFPPRGTYGFFLKPKYYCNTQSCAAWLHRCKRCILENLIKFITPMIQDLHSHMNEHVWSVCVRSEGARGMLKIHWSLQFWNYVTFYTFSSFGDLHLFKLCIQSETIFMAPFHISIIEICIKYNYYNVERVWSRVPAPLCLG